MSSLGLNQKPRRTPQSMSLRKFLISVAVTGSKLSLYSSITNSITASEAIRLSNYRKNSRTSKFLSAFGSSKPFDFSDVGMRPIVVKVCESAVRREEGTQCKAGLQYHNYTEHPSYHLCLDDWDGHSHGLGLACFEKFGPDTATLPCGQACLFKAVKTLVGRHASVDELLKWGITDFNLWNRANDLLHPQADGLDKHEFSQQLFHECADGGDRAFVSPTTVESIFDCLDSDKNGALDGAEITQPVGCFKKCLGDKELGKHMDMFDDDNDITDVLSMWLEGGTDVVKNLKDAVGTNGVDCISGNGNSPCSGCESYHVNFKPIDIVEEEQGEYGKPFIDREGDLVAECREFTTRCDDGLSGVSHAECQDDQRRQFCKGVFSGRDFRSTMKGRGGDESTSSDSGASFVDKCLRHYEKCCSNADEMSKGSDDMDLTLCKPCESQQCKRQRLADDDCFIHYSDSSDTTILGDGTHMKRSGSGSGGIKRSLDYDKLAFCAGVFEKARYEVIRSGEYNPNELTPRVSNSMFVQTFMNNRHHKKHHHGSQIGNRHSKSPYHDFRHSNFPVAKFVRNAAKNYAHGLEARGGLDDDSSIDEHQNSNNIVRHHSRGHHRRSGPNPADTLMNKNLKINTVAFKTVKNSHLNLNLNQKIEPSPPIPSTLVDADTGLEVGNSNNPEDLSPQEVEQMKHESKVTHTTVDKDSMADIVTDVDGSEGKNSGEDAAMMSMKKSTEDAERYIPEPEENQDSAAVPELEVRALNAEKNSKLFAVSSSQDSITAANSGIKDATLDDIDITVGTDPITQPTCPSEFGTDGAVRNVEYYNLFCSWMHSIAHPQSSWDSGIYIDNAAKLYAEQQFKADSTCQTEIVARNEGAVPRPTRKEIHDDNRQSCFRAYRICKELGNNYKESSDSDLDTDSGKKSCDYLASDVCEGLEFSSEAQKHQAVELPKMAIEDKNFSGPPEIQAPVTNAASGTRSGSVVTVQQPIVPPKLNEGVSAGTGASKQVIPAGTGASLEG